MKKTTITKPASRATALLATAGLLLSALLYSSCGHSNAEGNYQPPITTLPVFQVTASDAHTTEEYTASLEGTQNVEVRAQVDGYLSKIYVDEGAYVTKGQPLFKIDDRSYSEQYNNAGASLQAAKANVEKAHIEVERMAPLVAHNVISDVQLKTAQAVYDAAKAQLAQAQAAQGNAAINLGYTTVLAPASGFIGKIPYKTGSLVGRSEPQPLTMLSDVKSVYAYFSMSESAFLNFVSGQPGKTVQEKVKAMPPVELILADGSLYPEKGRVETVEGQFDKGTGSISFRAIFPNNEGILRSGNTGRVRITSQHTGTILLPEEATFELQDKIFVFAVGDSNKVSSKPIVVKGHSGNFYLVDQGVKPGDKIVFTGLDRLHDGAVIQPQPISLDSLLKTKPL
ncbi:efflux RND transporter periplasmic adaptor subunit [Chitinophaga costaii]|uniref:efflux RND transporter periplasmic adaptor subunit n=1 Tax=Chitinophaga costaii TaxID=1335309 RepID=UPI000B7F7E32|nr:efflux RND transporter periplasmic adaptor subunit [Chitinophaga costaii]PUZ29943.1 efflux RND transporter periplasmic adaptor subunit [Chitinophaga costaii]